MAATYVTEALRSHLIFNERECGVHGIKISGDIYKRVCYGLRITISHVAILNLSTGPIYDVIKMVA